MEAVEAQQVVMLTVIQQHAPERSTGACLCPHTASVFWTEREKAPGVLSRCLVIIPQKKLSLLTEHLPHLISLALHQFSAALLQMAFPFVVFAFVLIVLSLAVPVCACERETEQTSTGLQYIACYLLSVALLCGLVIEPVCLEADIDSVVYLFLTFMGSLCCIVAFIRNHGCLVLLPAFSGTRGVRRKNQLIKSIWREVKIKLRVREGKEKKRKKKKKRYPRNSNMIAQQCRFDRHGSRLAFITVS